jgi:hypothetical protein
MKDFELLEEAEEEPELIFKNHNIQRKYVF